MSSDPKILLVEGQDDEHVVRHLQMLCLPDVEFHVEDKHGIGELINAIFPEVRAPGRAAIGILADANGDPKGRWDDISEQLRRANIETPTAALGGGTIIDSDDDLPRVGIWLMPDNRSIGELEDFVKHMVPSDDPVWPLAEGYIRAVPAGAGTFAPGKASKAELHAWLATRRTPGRMGAAIRRGDLKAEGGLCADFLEWIRKLFE